MSLLTTSDHHLWPCHHLQPPLHDATPSHHCSHHPIHCCCIYYCCTKSTHQHPPSASHQLKWCIKTHHLGPVCFFCYYVFNFTDSFFVCFFFHTHAELHTHSWCLIGPNDIKMHCLGPVCSYYYLMLLTLFLFTNYVTSSWHSTIQWWPTSTTIHYHLPVPYPWPK